MIRRRLIIEWDDDATDTDEDCAKSFVRGDWSYADLVAAELSPKLWVEDAPVSTMGDN